MRISLGRSQQFNRQIQAHPPIMFSSLEIPVSIQYTHYTSHEKVRIIIGITKGVIISQMGKGHD